MKKKFTAPDFSITEFDAEDMLTVSVGTGPVDGGNDGWIEV